MCDALTRGEALKGIEKMSMALLTVEPSMVGAVVWSSGKLQGTWVCACLLRFCRDRNNFIK